MGRQSEWPEEKFLEKADEPFFQEATAFRGELIYSGREGDVIRIVYREYTGDFIRPAFAQELRYDLGESRIIRFRSLEIEILEADNSEITFRVLSHGGGPWD
jgi:hypothetical protein